MLWMLVSRTHMGPKSGQRGSSARSPVVSSGSPPAASRQGPWPKWYCRSSTRSGRSSDAAAVVGSRFSRTSVTAAWSVEGMAIADMATTRAGVSVSSSKARVLASRVRSSSGSRSWTVPDAGVD